MPMPQTANDESQALSRQLLHCTPSRKVLESLSQASQQRSLRFFEAFGRLRRLRRSLALGPAGAVAAPPAPVAAAAAAVTLPGARRALESKDSLRKKVREFLTAAVTVGCQHSWHGAAGDLSVPTSRMFMTRGCVVTGFCACHRSGVVAISRTEQPRMAALVPASWVLQAP